MSLVKIMSKSKVGKEMPHSVNCSKYCAKQHCLYCERDALHGTKVCSTHKQQVINPRVEK